MDKRDGTIPISLTKQIFRKGKAMNNEVIMHGDVITGVDVKGQTTTIRVAYMFQIKDRMYFCGPNIYFGTFSKIDIATEVTLDVRGNEYHWINDKSKLAFTSIPEEIAFFHGHGSDTFVLNTLLKRNEWTFAEAVEMFKSRQCDYFVNMEVDLNKPMLAQMPISLYKLTNVPKAYRRSIRALSAKQIKTWEDGMVEGVNRLPLENTSQDYVALDRYVQTFDFNTNSFVNMS